MSIIIEDALYGCQMLYLWVDRVELADLNTTGPICTFHSKAQKTENYRFWNVSQVLHNSCKLLLVQLLKQSARALISKIFFQPAATLEASSSFNTWNFWKISHGVICHQITQSWKWLLHHSSGVWALKQVVCLTTPCRGAVNIVLVLPLTYNVPLWSHWFRLP